MFDRYLFDTQLYDKHPEYGKDDVKFALDAGALIAIGRASSWKQKEYVPYVRARGTFIGRRF